MINNPYPIQIKKRILFNLIYGIISIALICLIFWLFLIIVKLIFQHQGPLVSTILISVTAIMGLILLAIYTIWDFLYLNSIEYSLDSKNLIFKGGVVSRFEKVIPYSKIQHAIIYESFWQRILGLSSMSIKTAREFGAGVLILDLLKEDAEKLRDYIISISNKYKSVAGI